VSSRGITLRDLAQRIGAELKGNNDLLVSGLNSIDEAGPEQVSFVSKAKYLPSLSVTNAGAVILSKEDSKLYSGNSLVGKNPYLLYAKASKVFKELLFSKNEMVISSSASIAKSSKIANSVSIGDFVTISENAEIADNVVIGNNCFIGKKVSVGNGTVIHPNTSLYSSVQIGEDCIIHSGVVIGSDGLGFAKDGDKWIKIEHLGRVVVGDDVEIGSNTSIDRGSVGDTLIGDNVKIDNLVHIAHNVEIGYGTAIAARSAIAGSTKIGSLCTLAGCCAVVDNVKIVDKVHITAMTLVTKSITQSGVYSSGTPMMKNSDWKKSAVRFKKLKD